MTSLLPLLAALLMASAAVGGQPVAPLSVPGTLAFLVAWYALGRGFADHLATAARQPGADPRTSLARFRRVVALHRLAVLPAMAVLLWPGGWSALVRDVRASTGEDAALLLALAPFPALHVISRAATFPAERRLGFQALSLGASLLQGGRLALFFLGPVILSSAILGAISMLQGVDLPPVRAAVDFAARYDIVGGVVFLAGLAAVLVVYPPLGMAIVGARSMKDGTLRRRLEAYARRVGLRYRDLYVWPTRGTLVNAAVLGVGGRLRCVVFTDSLLEQLDEEEVEAVFAHEAGHALHHHLPLFFLFTVGFLLAGVAGARMLPTELALLLEGNTQAALVAALAAMGLYFGLLFGFVSRRLEQQADVHGLLTVGLPEGEDPSAVLADPARHPFLRAAAEGRAVPAEHPFVRGLDGLAASMGGVRELTGWRHFSIADRVEFLGRFVREPAVRETYRRRLRGLLALLAGMLLLFAAAAATDLPLQMRGADPAAALRRAEAHLRAGRVPEARAWIETGLRGAEARGLLLVPAFARAAPGQPVAEASALVLAQGAADPGLSPLERLRSGECDALLRSVMGRPAEAVAAAEHALRGLDGVACPPEIRAEALLVLADLLTRDGRPAAAAAARGEAGALRER